MIGPLLIINGEMDNTVPWAVANASYRGRSTPSPDRVPATAGVQPGAGHLRVCAGRVQHAVAAAAPRLRWVVMPVNRMNRDEFYTAMAPNDDARLRKILWTLYWRGNAQLRERIEDELRSPEQPKVKPRKELPDPGTVLDEVTTFVKLAMDGAYMAGDRRVHRTERSRWRLTFRRLVGDALAALQADDPGPAQQAVAEMVDLACDTEEL